MEIFNRRVFTARKTIGIFLILTALCSIFFYFLLYYPQSPDATSKLEADPYDIPLNQRNESQINMFSPSEIIIPKKSDPMGTHTIVDTKVQ